jgi:hypothetical protein
MLHVLYSYYSAGYLPILKHGSGDRADKTKKKMEKKGKLCNNGHGNGWNRSSHKMTRKYDSNM